MSGEFQQSAVNVASERASVAIASGVTTAVTGLSTYLEYLPAVTGFVGMSIGSVVSLGLFYLTWKKNRLERKQLHLQIAVLEGKESERLERSAARISDGEPVRRSDD